MAETIFESAAADAGINTPQFPIPSEHTQAVKWIVQRLSKLTNDRRLTAERISTVRSDAKADGISAEEISSSLKLGKMSPERRTKHVEALKTSYRMFGFQIDIADEDPPKDAKWTKIQKYLHTLKILGEERKETSKEIADLCAAAKARGMNTPVLKQIVKLSKLDPEDREEYFANLDNMGAILGYW